MAVDITRFDTRNVSDTCSIWNVLSSGLLFTAARQAGCQFVCTDFVRYECLHKPRSSPTPQDEEMKKRLRREIERGQFANERIELSDLDQVGLLEQRRRLSKGELSSIVLAAKSSRAFLTDDQGARRLASQVLSPASVQTTPQLFGWLVFRSFLSDSDLETVVSQHEAMKRPLRNFFEECCSEGLRGRAYAHMTRVPESASEPESI